jgi:hypothetical protein
MKKIIILREYRPKALEKKMNKLVNKGYKLVRNIFGVTEEDYHAVYVATMRYEKIKKQHASTASSKKELCHDDSLNIKNKQEE